MFRNFSFNPVSRPHYERQTEHVATAVCPTSMSLETQKLPSRLPTPPPCSIGDLAQKLTQQSLRLESRVHAYPSAPLTPPSDKCTFVAEPLDKADRPTYSRISASVLRMQRQASVQMQCCSSHIKDVSRLARMVECEEQCTVNASVSSSAEDEDEEDDEGIDMDYDSSTRRSDLLAGMPHWRSGERRDGCARVTKSVRMRRRTRDEGVKNIRKVT